MHETSLATKMCHCTFRYACSRCTRSMVQIRTATLMGGRDSNKLLRIQHTQLRRKCLLRKAVRRTDELLCALTLCDPGQKDRRTEQGSRNLLVSREKSDMLFCRPCALANFTVCTQCWSSLHHSLTNSDQCKNLLCFMALPPNRT